MFTTIIKIYGTSGNFDGCLTVFEEMKALGVKPNLVCYNTLLDAMGRATRPWQVKSIYQQLLSSGLTPGWATYVSLIRAYGKVRYGDDTMIVYKEMRAKGMNLNKFFTTPFCLCIVSPTTGRIHRRSQYSRVEMVESGFQPNIYVLISLIQCYGKADRTYDVVTTFDRIIALGITPDERTCGCLLNVMTQTPREELGKLTRCVQIVNPKLECAIV
ncbi:putative tetratricopeptide-like helical domain superfamily [Helianthus anomalus]